MDTLKAVPYRVSLCTDEDFVGRVQILFTKYAFTILKSDAEKNSKIRHLALDLLLHTEDYRKRMPIYVAAMLSIDDDYSDETFSECIATICTLLTGEEI